MWQALRLKGNGKGILVGWEARRAWQAYESREGKGDRRFRTQIVRQIGCQVS